MNKSNRILLNWLQSSACGYDVAHVVMIERMAPISGNAQNEQAVLRKQINKRVNAIQKHFP